MRYLLLALCWAIGLAEASDLPPASCGEFSGSICYNVDGGDVVTHKIIIDFSIDEIDLKDGAHVTIYQGLGLAEQENVGNIEKIKEYDSPSGEVSIFAGSKRPNRYFDVHYTPKQGWGKVQVFGYLKDKKTAQLVAKFISSIHPCKRDNLTESCTSDSPLAQAANVMDDLAD